VHAVVGIAGTLEDPMKHVKFDNIGDPPPMSRAASLAALGAALLVAKASSAARAQAAALTTVRVGSVPTDAISPLLYAMRSGMFEKVGLRIDLQTFSGGAATTLALIGGALDIGFANLVPITQAHLRGIAVAIIAPGQLWIDSNTGGLLVRKDSPLATARDFNGKVVSSASLLGIGTVAMEAWMDQNGGDSKTLHFLELPWQAAGAALQQGRIDASIVDNPFYAQALADGSVRTVTRVYTAIAKQFLLAAWFATGGYLAQNHSVAARFSRVIADAAAYTRTHPAQMVDDIARLTKQDPTTIAHMQQTSVGTTVDVADIQPVIDVAAKYHLIANTFPAADIVSEAAVR
jgi:NitT/TauT family transport system substrate-binding protein